MQKITLNIPGWSPAEIATARAPPRRDVLKPLPPPVRGSARSGIHWGFSSSWFPVRPAEGTISSPAPNAGAGQATQKPASFRSVSRRCGHGTRPPPPAMKAEAGTQRRPQQASVRVFISVDGTDVPPPGQDLVLTRGSLSSRPEGRLGHTITVSRP